MSTLAPNTYVAFYGGLRQAGVPKKEAVLQTLAKAVGDRVAWTDIYNLLAPILNIESDEPPKKSLG